MPVTIPHPSFDGNYNRNFNNGRTGISPDEMAQLEFRFLTALEHSEYGIPNLDRQIAESPKLFVQVLVLAYGSNDDGQGTLGSQIGDHERHKMLARAAYRLLRLIKYIPGTSMDGKVDAERLFDWLTETQQLCAQHNLAEKGELEIGQILSKSPIEEDGSWPCLPVCQAMERVASQHIGTGFEIGVYNGRGVVVRGVEHNGAQERDLAAKYRDWAKLRAFEYPYVSSILESIATGYDRDAKQEDNQRKIRKRLWH